MGASRKYTKPEPAVSCTQILVLGDNLVPEDIAAEGLLTAEDYREIALDHIDRTSDFVFRLQITRRS